MPTVPMASTQMGTPALAVTTPSRPIEMTAARGSPALATSLAPMLQAM